MVWERSNIAGSLDIVLTSHKDGHVSQGYFLAVAGNIGVGKTELTHRLSEELGWAAYYEPVIQNPYLDPFYENMPRWSFHLQIYFLSERFKAQVEIGKSAQPFIQDRTIYEDAEIFARNLFEQKMMTKRDWEVYQRLYTGIRRMLRPPDVLIAITCSLGATKKRIHTRGRAMEQKIPDPYLRRLHRLYTRWFGAYDLSPIVTIDTTKMDYVEDLVDLIELQRALDRALG